MCLENANRVRKDDDTLYVYKNNTDGKGNSYGYHENYLMKRSTPFERIVKGLTPFLVTRQIYAERVKWEQITGLIGGVSDLPKGRFL